MVKNQQIKDQRYQRFVRIANIINNSIILNIDILPLIPELNLIDNLFFLPIHHGLVPFFLLRFRNNMPLGWVEISHRYNNFLDKVEESIKIVV